MRQRLHIHLARMFFAILLLVGTLLLARGTALAVPDCYAQAALPAHVWAMQGVAKDTAALAITALAINGEQCVSIPLWRGMPLLRAEMFVPFSTLYEAYAEAVTQRDTAAVQRIYAWLRPTPRPFSEWIALFSAGGPPQPWGIQGLLAVVKILQTDSQTMRRLPTTPDYLQNSMRDVWPLLFIDMGGIPLPDGVRTSAPGWSIHMREYWQHVYPGMYLQEFSGRRVSMP